MSEDINTTINIRYETTGIDSSIRQSQRLLYTMNAVRLSVRDIQDVMAGPTLQNVMWTAIQLTRVWTSLYRLVNATNVAQRRGLAGGLFGGGGRVTSGAFAGGQTTLAFGANGMLGRGGAANPSLLARVFSLAMLHPYAAAAVGITTAVVGVALWTKFERDAYISFQQKQRDTAKSQGLEY